MRRSKLKFSITVICILLLLTACSDSQPEVGANITNDQSSEAKTNSSENPADKSTTQSSDTQTNTGENSTGQQQERGLQNRADLYGRVKSIIGNEVVMELAEMPQRVEGQERTGEGSGNLQNGQMPVPGAGVPGAGGGAGFAQRSGQREIKLTGETVTILLPVGVPINTFSVNGAKEIDMADIYAGNMMQIWYEDSEAENKTITRIMVIQGR